MLKTEMIDKLNEQMNLELYSSLLYQQMSAGAVIIVLKGCGLPASPCPEEMTHMQRLFDYLTDTGSLPRINAIASRLPSMRHWMNCSARPMSTSS